LVIAKFDHSANEIANDDIEGYPTIRFYPKGGLPMVKYQGQRDLTSLLKFLAEHSIAYGEMKAKESMHWNEDL